MTQSNKTHACKDYEHDNAFKNHETVIIEITTSFPVSHHPDIMDNLEEHAYIDEYKGVIYTEDEYGFKADKIGRFKFRLFNVASAHEDDFYVKDLFDGRRGDYEFYTYLYEDSDSDDFSKSQFEYDSVCILDRLNIKKQFRKNGISKLIIEEVIRRFSRSFDIMLTKPYPLNLKGKGATHQDEINKAISKLIKLYCSMGAVHVKPLDSIVIWVI